MEKKQAGFTLVEIAIVLVIISLLLGGILKGQELINSTKVKSLVNDFRSTAAAYYSYQDRFRAIAGDDAGVVAHVGGTLATTPASTVGNGRINGWPFSTTTTDESMLFWQHVRLAGLLTGSTTVAAGYNPLNAAGGQLGVTAETIDSAGTLSGTVFICASGIDGRSARQMDSMMDDGISNTGSLRLYAAAPTAAAAAVAPAAVTDGTIYVVCSAN